MTTIVNNPPPPKESDSGLGIIIGVIIIAVASYTFVVFGIPALRRNIQTQAPEITIPDKIEVNINQPTQ